MGPNIALHPNQWLYLGIESITHELELAIRGDEAYRSVVLKTRQPYALMKFHIFHLDRLSPSCSTCRLKHDLVVEAQT